MATREEKRRFLESYYCGRHHLIRSPEEHCVKIENAISSVGNLELQMILTHRYIKREKIEPMCYRFHVSRATMFRYINEALDAVEIPE